MRITMQKPNSERRWAVVRLLLGMLQMGGAVVALVLVGTVGVTPLSLTVVVVTGLCTTLSVLLFGSRQRRPPFSRKEHDE